MKKILIIEDNIDVRENTADILKLEGFEAITATNGKEGIQKAMQQRPDLIICDIMMPKMDGYEVLEYLSNRPQSGGIPFIFLSAKSEKSDMRKGMNLGADDYLTKPFEASELLDAINCRLDKNTFLKKEFEKNLDGIHAFIKEASDLLGDTIISTKYDIANYERSEDVYLEGHPANNLFYIKSGSLKTYKTTETGKEFVTGMYGPGKFVGQLSILSKKESYIETATALEALEVFKIPKSDFLKLIGQDHIVSQKFINIISNDLVEIQDHLINMAFTPVRQRAARALLELADKGILKYEDDHGAGIPRDDFAGLIGTATETAVRALSQFRSEGLIKMGSLRKIIILNKEKLQHIADYNLVH
ncbi:response regulator [Spongiivirga citrea]|uniref:Response regulator n=1 Tax=Spongiivirga citrea TaxID=1481457 RepID=A0A6M0CP74_9FLAO|nr:response regulator [Spongiivirga citrea]NER15730.1 response regulator [Spongiivirga citrea]